jgi:hypothetical protein
LAAQQQVKLVLPMQDQLSDLDLDLDARTLQVDEIACSLRGAREEIDALAKHDIDAINLDFDWIDEAAIDERLDSVLKQCQGAAAESLSECQANILASFETALEGYKIRLEASHDELKMQKLEECTVNLVDGSEKTVLRREMQDLENACQSHERAKCDAEQQAAELRSALEQKEKEFEAVLAAKEQEFKITLASKQKELNSALEKLANHERANAFKQQNLQELQKRREEHNRLIEVQGNIRVFCRLRPMLSSEASDKVAVTVGRSEDEKGLVFVRRPAIRAQTMVQADSEQKGQEDIFAFDESFGEWSSQKEGGSSSHAAISLSNRTALKPVRCTSFFSVSCSSALLVVCSVRVYRPSRRQCIGWLQRVHLCLRANRKRQDFHHGREG